MANWCSTSYTIVGEKSDIMKIYNALKCHSVKDKSDDNWEGNILHTLGVSYDDIEKRCMRGFISDYQLFDKNIYDDAQLQIYCDEAWTRTDFAEMLGSLFPEISVYWIAEEPGCDYFLTNDDGGNFYQERYWVDTCINGDYQSEYFETIEGVYKWLSSISSCKNEEDVEKFNNDAAEAKSEDFINIHEYDVV